MSKESEEKANGNQEGGNHSSDLAKVPRSRTYFQHDDHGIARQDGRRFGGRTDSEHGWWRDSRVQLNGSGRAESKILSSDTRWKDEKAKDDREHNMWHHAAKVEKREERVHYLRYYDKPERPFARERESIKGEAWRGNFTPRDRYSSSGRYRDRDQFTGRQVYHPVGDGGRAEKWKHDLYNEANRGPTPKNDEDKISKIEALLAS